MTLERWKNHYFIFTQNSRFIS